MSLNLCIDIGNTRIKAGLFNGKILLKTFFLSNENEFQKEISNLKIDSAIISDVSKDKGIIDIIKKYVSTISYVDQTSKLPIKNLYNTKKTLGNDRLANAIGAFSIFPNQDVLAIDAGTCITFDLLTKKAEYMGGSIAPGIKMRLDAMHSLTSRLPLVEWNNKERPPLVSNSTEACLLSGAVNGALAEVDGIIDQYKKQFSELKTIVTGGNTIFFEKELKNGIFADQNLVLKGLNEIHLYKSENP